LPAACLNLQRERYAVDRICRQAYTPNVSWDVEYTNEFSDWWMSLTEDEQDAVAIGIRKLETLGLALGYPHSSQVKGSRHGRMRELRIQVHGRPFRVFYAFNPERNAILLIGADKGTVGDDRFYELFVPLADSIYDEHLAELAADKRREQKSNG
jgi:hypothetical protein